MRTFLAVLVGVVLLVPTAGAASAAPPPQPVCGQPIVTSVKLKADLNCGINVEADNVTLNLAGHTIRGTVFVTGNDVTVKRGNITASTTYLAYIRGANAVLQNLTISGSTGGWAVEAGEGTTIRRSTFRDNAGVAVDQFFEDNLVVENSDFLDNGVGVAIVHGSGAVIRRNKFVGNRTGVRLYDENLSGASETKVLDNSFASNNVGIRLDAQADAVNNLIDGNNVKDSASSGILVTSQGIVIHPFTTGGGRGTTIRNNTVTRSGSVPTTVTGCQGGGTPQCSTTADDGITVLAPADIAATMVLSNNRVTHSAGLGIEAPNVTDGGLNSAKKNGVGGCVGVSCP